MHLELVNFCSTTQLDPGISIEVCRSSSCRSQCSRHVADTIGCAASMCAQIQKSVLALHWPRRVPSSFTVKADLADLYFPSEHLRQSTIKQIPTSVSVEHTEETGTTEMGPSMQKQLIVKQRHEKTNKPKHRSVHKQSPASAKTCDTGSIHVITHKHATCMHPLARGRIHAYPMHAR